MKMISFAIDGILGFSVAPLRFILGLGFAISLLSLAVGVLAIVLKLAGQLPPVQGWASLTVLVTFLAGIQLIVLGTVGLYVARVYEQGKNRPLYLVASAEGLEAGPSGPLRERRILRSEGEPTEPTLDPSQ
jgi:dolichol-phosphate mannosyltransferase